jgi:hypothetical protein
MSKKVQIIGIIRILMVLLLIGFIISLQSGGKISDADINDVAQSVIAQLDMSSMQESPHRNFKKFYGLNAADYEGVVLYSPVTNMDAEELLIVKLKDTSQAEAVETAINKRLETQKNSFEGYGIEQYDLLEKHVLDVQGNYILYVVHTDAAKADQAFRDSL